MNCTTRTRTKQATAKLLADVEALAKVSPGDFVVEAVRDARAANRKLTLILARIEQEMNGHE